MKKYIVIGNPINHSLSPKLHNHWIKKNNIDAIYEKKQISESDINKIINEVRNGKIIDTGDFSQTMSKRKIFPGMDPAILVIKKNVSMLKNIIEWLSEQDGVETDDKINLSWQSSGDGTRLPKNKLIVNTPLLLIDDESDSASLDISKREGGNRALVEYEDEDAKARALANPSQTNLLIRRILESFNKKAYIYISE